MNVSVAKRRIAAVVLSNASVFGSREALEMELLLAAVARPGNEPAIRAALATSHDTQAAIYTTEAALALSVGDLARPSQPVVRQRTRIRTESRVVPNK